jgi:hypothetical protein
VQLLPYETLHFLSSCQWSGGAVREPTYEAAPTTSPRLSPGEPVFCMMVRSVNLADGYI